MEKIILYCKKFLFENTEAQFDEYTVPENFDRMKCKPDIVHWFSPSGESEFILTSDWYIFRRGKWPVTNNGCKWTKNGNSSVGYIHISNFKKTYHER